MSSFLGLWHLHQLALKHCVPSKISAKCIEILFNRFLFKIAKRSTHMLYKKEIVALVLYRIFSNLKRQDLVREAVDVERHQ